MGSSGPSLRGGRGMSRGGGLVSTRQSVRPSSKDGFGRGGPSGRGLGLGALSGRGGRGGGGGGDGSELKPLGIGFNEGLLARRALITVGPDSDDDDSDDDWNEQGAVSFCVVCMSISVCWSVCLSLCLSVCLLICLAWLSVRLSVYLSVSCASPSLTLLMESESFRRA